MQSRKTLIGVFFRVFFAALAEGEYSIRVTAIQSKRNRRSDLSGLVGIDMTAETRSAAKRIFKKGVVASLVPGKIAILFLIVPIFRTTALIESMLLFLLLNQALTKTTDALVSGKKSLKYNSRTEEELCRTEWSERKSTGETEKRSQMVSDSVHQRDC